MDVAKTKAGLVAQQEVDDAEGKDLAAEAARRAAESNLEAAQSQLEHAQASAQHDQALFDYVEHHRALCGRRHAAVRESRNAGAGRHQLQHAGDAARAAVQDDLFRLVIPVPESYVRYIHIGDPVQRPVPVARTARFPGKVARFSVDVKEDTRTMHTEVDVPNPDHVLIPGLYAEATITLERTDRRARGAAAGGGSAKASRPLCMW